MKCLKTGVRQKLQMNIWEKIILDMADKVLWDKAYLELITTSSSRHIPMLIYNHLDNLYGIADNQRKLIV